MHKFPRRLPAVGDPADPDHFHEALQPFDDGSQNLDEHDMEGGGLTNTAGVDTSIYAGNVESTALIDPGIVNGLTSWVAANGIEVFPSTGWQILSPTANSVAVSDGLVYVTGLVQVAVDPSVATASGIVAITFTVDNVPYLTLDPAEANEWAVAFAGTRFGGCELSLPMVLEGIFAVPPGQHTFALALQVRDRYSLFTYTAHLSVIDLRA